MKYKQRESGSLDRSEGKTETIPGEYGSQFISSKFWNIFVSPGLASASCLTSPHANMDPHHSLVEWVIGS